MIERKTKTVIQAKEQYNTEAKNKLRKVGYISSSDFVD